MTATSAFQQCKENLAKVPRTWLVTGCAGFIGSNLLETLLSLNQTVTGLDNFATGHQRNLDEVQNSVTAEQWSRFTFINGDIRDLETCHHSCTGVDYILHQAALGSVPRSIADPIASTENNINGTLNMLIAARDNNIKRLVYASSSSVYGDHPSLPKVENQIGNPLSPYAVTKYVNELYAAQGAKHYGLECIGLRYFNVFGPRQDPNGSYAAVIPKWIAAMIKGESIKINGTGETSRDFCYVENVVQANILAATTKNPEAINQNYNIALNDNTTLNQLYEKIHKSLQHKNPTLADTKPIYVDFRPGDVMHSQADITKAKQLLCYSPTHTITEGLEKTVEWYIRNI